jgi:hypothetical protein
MIVIAGKLANPSTWTGYAGYDPGRQGEILTYEGDRGHTYAWGSNATFTAWATKATGAVDPIKTATDPSEVLKARQLKHQYEMLQNSTQLLPALSDKTSHAGRPSHELPNFGLHHKGPKDTFYRDNPSTQEPELFQLKPRAMDVDNDDRLGRSQITTYEQSDTGYFHTHSNVGKDVIHSRTDSRTNPASGGYKPTKEQIYQRGLREYGGHKPEDFSNGTRKSLRGHTSGYADTIPEKEIEHARIGKLSGGYSPYAGRDGYRKRPNQKSKSKYKSRTTNDNPLSYYAEGDAGDGESFGEKIRNHSFEAHTRKAEGIYTQANEYGPTSTKLASKRRVPSRYHLHRHGPYPYASFSSSEAFGGTAEDEWDSHVQPTTTFPAPTKFDDSSSLRRMFPAEPTWTDCPPTPEYMPFAYEEYTETTPTVRKPGESVAGTGGQLPGTTFHQISETGGQHDYQMGRSKGKTMEF